MYFLLFLQQLIASSTHVVSKDLTSMVAPPTVLFIRSGIAALIYIIWMLLVKRKFFFIEKKDFPVLLLLSALNIPINQFLFFTAISMTTAPNVALAYGLTPVFVFIIAGIFLKETVNWKKFIGIVLAFAGAALVFFQKGINFSSSTFLGDMLILAASLSWGLYTIFGKSFTRKYGAIYSTSMTMSLGYIMYLPIYLLLQAEFEPSKIAPANWLQMAYLGIFTSVVGYAIWYYALTKIEASKVAVFNNIQPIFTTILAIIFLGHVIEWNFVAGAVFVIIGVILVQRS